MDGEIPAVFQDFDKAIAHGGFREPGSRLGREQSWNMIREYLGDLSPELPDRPLLFPQPP